MSKYIICKICFQTNKTPIVLAVIDEYGILNIKRYHKASTVISGADITVTCDQCGSSLVLHIRRKQPIPTNIIGTINIEETQFIYSYKN